MVEPGGFETHDLLECHFFKGLPTELRNPISRGAGKKMLENRRLQCSINHVFGTLKFSIFRENLVSCVFADKLTKSAGAAASRFVTGRDPSGGRLSFRLCLRAADLLQHIPPTKVEILSARVDKQPVGTTGKCRNPGRHRGESVGLTFL